MDTRLALELAGVKTPEDLSYLAGPSPDAGAVARFFEGAAAFWECAPWEVLESEEVLEVEGLGPQPLVLSVRGGEEGEEPGLAVFRSREDARSLRRSQALLVFATSEEAGPSLGGEIQAQGFRLAEPEAVPLAVLRGHRGLADAAGLSSLVRCMQVVERFLEMGLDERESVEQVALTLPDRGRARVTWREVDPFAELVRRGPAPAAKEPEPEPAGPAKPTPFRHGPRPGRNDPCWCGSGQKYKKCHLDEDRQADSASLHREE